MTDSRRKYLIKKANMLLDKIEKSLKLIVEASKSKL